MEVFEEDEEVKELCVHLRGRAKAESEHESRATERVTIQERCEPSLRRRIDEASSFARRICTLASPFTVERTHRPSSLAQVPRSESSTKI